MGKRILTALLLALIVLYGGALRLVGQNWDDFSHIHPDERFLTLFVLPQLGGGNRFTADQERLPDQQLLVRADGGERNWQENGALSQARVGLLPGTVGSDAANWLGFADRSIVYEAYHLAEIALMTGAVDALLVEASQLPSDSGRVFNARTIPSTELQALRCAALYPNSGGSGGYFDARCSPLNPHNTGQSFYVYGTFPLFLAHFASEILRQASAADLPLLDFQAGHLVWRGLSMLFDTLAILLVFALGARMQNRWVGLLAALFYAAAPLAIQKAHFGTVNAIAACMVTLALYFAVGAHKRGRLADYILFGVACGLAVASRINLAPLAGVIIVAAALRALPAIDSRTEVSERMAVLLRNSLGLILAGLAAFLAFRLFNPYTFDGPGFFGILPNPRWLANLAEISSGVSGLRDYPPNWQWVGRSPLLHSFKDMVFWGMGLSFGILGWLGAGWAGYRLLRNRKRALGPIMPLVWIFGYYLFISRVWAIVPRYYLPLYGALAVMAGWCLFEILRQGRASGSRLSFATLPTALFGGALLIVGGAQLLSGVRDTTSVTAFSAGAILLGFALVPPLRRWQARVLLVLAVGFSLLWGLMFSNIYRHQTTLVQAARYIQERVPGDFAMRIDGAGDRQPLINIAFHNTGVALPGFAESPYNGANHYYEATPARMSFSVPASGRITEVFAPHLGDPLDDEQPEELSIRIYAQGAAEPLSVGTLHANLARTEHPLGNAYSIPLSPPLEVQAGDSYTFVFETALGSGDVIGSGAVVLTEGSWDNHITGVNLCPLPAGMTLADNPPAGLVSARDCLGTQAHYAQVNSQDQILSYPVDNQTKYDDLLRTLEIGDYLTIASNRFYDAEARLPLRFPLTMLYYEKLFDGELGFELVASFDETFEFGPWRASDQHLPMYDSPSWLNELEADESLHVYDHPAAFIFRKTDGYSQARAEAILSQVSLRQAHELSNSEGEAALLGVINWTVAEADGVPTALNFPRADYARQSSGGTWSQRFFSDALVNSNQVVGVAIWYLTIFAFGIIAFPLTQALLPKMADGGYGISKLVGMLLVAWLAWAVSALKIPIWSQAGILFALAALALLSGWLGYRNREQLRAFLKQHWRRLAWMEAIALLAFLIMIVVRLTNPDLWHPAKGGEKPMDFAYLNGVLRSSTFPPLDPWFAGGFINYYYFGYVLLGAPTLLLGVVPAFAYNLMIPTIFSLTGMGAFSAAFNIQSRWRRSEPSSSPQPRRAGNPWLAGVMALALCIGLGNLDTVRVLGNGIARLGGYSTPLGLEDFLIEEYSAKANGAPSPETRAELAQRAREQRLADNLRYEAHNAVTLWRGILQGIGKALQGQEPPIGSDRWYWGPSRVLAETPGVGGGAITEMPYFTFLYGDLHAHMISMPIVLLAVLLLFNELASVGSAVRRPLERACAIALLALSVGILQATNTWDWPSMTLFAVLGLGYCWYLRWRHSFRPVGDMRFIAGTVIALAGIGIALSLLLPALQENALASAAQIMRLVAWSTAGVTALLFLMRSMLARASALDLAAQVGGFLLLNVAFALPYTSWYAATYNSVRLWQGGKTPLWAYFDIHGLFLFLTVSLLCWLSANWLRATPVKTLIEQPARLKAAIAAILLGAVAAIGLTLLDYQVALIVIPLLVWISLLFFAGGGSRAMRFTLVLIGFALSMTLGVEIIVIGGDIGRQNTVFKFYMQVWLLLSVAGGVAFACIYEASERFSPRLKLLWFVPCAILIFIAALFPITGTRARSLDRMVPDLPLTLNGLDYMTGATHYESSPVSGSGSVIDLSVDYELIRWLQENVAGSPVIIEGRRRPSEYQWNGRISIATGLPSVLGWNFHQRQQRTFHPLPRWVDQREQNIQQFYTTPNIDIAVDILRHFDIQYIIRSGLEAVHSTPAGLRKFDAMVDMGLLTIAHSVAGGTIYSVDDDALLTYLMERQS